MVVGAVVTGAEAAGMVANTYVSDTVLSVLLAYIHLFLVQFHEVLKLRSFLLRD